MTYFYSPSKKGWYPDHISYPNLPDDLVAVDDAVYAQWLDQPGSTVSIQNNQLRVIPPAVVSLDQIKMQKIAELRNQYADSLYQPVEYTTEGGVTAKFSTRDSDRNNIRACLDAGEKSWSSNIWLDINGVPVFPFSYEDLTRLSELVDRTAQPEYQSLLSKIAEVNSAPDADSVRNVEL